MPEVHGPAALPRTGDPSHATSNGSKPGRGFPTTAGSDGGPRTGGAAGSSRSPGTAIWLSWHTSSRSRMLAEALGLPFVAWQVEAPALLRHPLSAGWTLLQLTSRRPRTVFIQHSFLLTLLLGVYRKVVPWPVDLVADCHTKALRRRI